MKRENSIHIARRNAGTGQKQRSGGFRILLYSHDSYGLGHLRRNLAIAGALLERIPGSSAVIVTGSPCATRFPLPPRCDVVKMPAIGKDSGGNYVPRSLDISLNQTVAMRRRLILTTFESFDPDMILVDHQPAGLLGEMLDTLRRSRAAGKLTLFGMRDIVDTPAVIEETWCSRECLLALDRLYDHIFVYGDTNVFDPLKEYPLLRRFRHKLSLPGYVVERNRLPKRKPAPDGRRQVLVTVGGGDDGSQRIRSYLDALALEPATWSSHIVTGPLLEKKAVRAYRQFVRHGQLEGPVRITRFHGDIPGLMHQADAVVSMAGYNSCLEILRSGTPAVLMPRSHMRLEQQIRADRLAAMGLVQTVPAGDARVLRAAIERALASPRCQAVSLNLEGLGNICGRIVAMAGLVPAATRSSALSGAGSQPE